MASAGADAKTVRVWDVATGECVRTLKGHTSIVWDVRDLGGGRMASGSNDGTVRVWDVA